MAKARGEWAEGLCRTYQRFFAPDYDDEARLTRLHKAGVQSGNLEPFLTQYFADEFAKGGMVIDRFSALSAEWRGGRALDFGAGGGGLTCRIASELRGVVGIDIDLVKLEFARREAQRRGLDSVAFVHYDGQLPLPFPDASFDSIFCIDVVEHLPTPERFLVEFRRVLKPGGLLLLSFGPPWGHPHGKHLWSKLPGWWTHLIFPQATVMRVLGRPPSTTYEDLGMFKLTVGEFDRALRRSGFAVLSQVDSIKAVLAPLKHVPVLRELFIGEVIGVYRNPPDRVLQPAPS